MMKKVTIHQSIVDTYVEMVMEHQSIHGERLKKLTWWKEDDLELYESDVNEVTRFLIDNYGDSDESSVGHTVLTFDIEVEMLVVFLTLIKQITKLLRLKDMIVLQMITLFTLLTKVRRLIKQSKVKGRII